MRVNKKLLLLQDKRYTWVQQLLVLIAIWAYAFSSALETVIKVWWVSDTFTHCFFVLPAAIYFAWLEREKLAAVELRPNYYLAPVLLLALFVGLLGEAGGVQLFTHISAFGSLSIIAWMLLGNNAAKILWFPLVFVGFAVPIGDELIPFFQKITADMAVFLLEWSGVAVYRTGLYLQIPEGRFVVAEACSGVRFFVASVAFGAAYSYMSFKVTSKRIAFFLLSIILPIIGNGIRVYGIIMIAHFSDMKYAVGADHLVYGWVFFAFILFLMILIGERMRAAVDKVTVRPVPSSALDKWGAVQWQPRVIVVLVVLIGFKLWVGQVAHQQQIALDKYELPASLFVADDDPPESWKPEFKGASTELFRTLKVNQGERFALYVARYKQNEEGREIISYANRLFDIELWSIDGEGTRFIDEHRTQPAKVLHLTSSNDYKRVLAYWYVMPSGVAVSPLEVKLRQALDRLFGGHGGGAIVIYTAEVGRASFADAERELIEEVRHSYDLINVSVDVVDK